MLKKSNWEKKMCKENEQTNGQFYSVKKKYKRTLTLL